MSTENNENVGTENQVITFENSLSLINDKYLTFINCFIEKFKYHEELIGSLESDLKFFNDKIQTNKYLVIDIITENFLYCFEQIADHNSDYFIYQKDKVQKKNGKVYKNKLPKIGHKTLLKKILGEMDTKTSNIVFKGIIDFFQPLLVSVDGQITFNEDYVEYVKNNFTENKNFSKMIMAIDNINNFINNQVEDVEEVLDNDTSEDETDKKDSKNKHSSRHNKNKKNKKNGGDAKGGMDFMNGLENTKIAQLAKNISEKINMDDFPILTDPSKLLSSLSNPSDNGNGVQDLLKFVIGEVEGAFKNNDLKETDLVSEAQNIMGQFSNMSGFDPMSILKDGNIDMNQFSDIFSNLGKK